MSKIIKFNQAFPTYKDFEGTIQARVVEIVGVGVEYIDDAKMFSKWETIYKSMMNQYSKRYLRYDKEEWISYATNYFVQYLPKLYSQQLILVKDKFKEISGDMDLIQRISSVDKSVRSSNPSNTKITDDEKLDLKGVGVDNGGVGNSDTKATRNTLGQALLLEQSNIVGTLLNFVATFNDLFLDITNDKVIQALENGLVDIAPSLYEVLKGTILGSLNVNVVPDDKLENLVIELGNMFVSDFAEFEKQIKDGNAPSGTIRWTNGITLGHTSFLLNDTGTIKEFKTWLEIKNYIDEQNIIIKNRIDSNDKILQDQINILKSNGVAIPHFKNDAERDLAIPNPKEGQVAYTGINGAWVLNTYENSIWIKGFISQHDTSALPTGYAPIVKQFKTGHVIRKMIKGVVDIYIPAKFRKVVKSTGKVSEYRNQIGNYPNVEDKRVYLENDRTGRIYLVNINFARQIAIGIKRDSTIKNYWNETLDNYFKLVYWEEETPAQTIQIPTYENVEFPTFTSATTLIKSVPRVNGNPPSSPKGVK